MWAAFALLKLSPHAFDVLFRMGDIGTSIMTLGWDQEGDNPDSGTKLWKRLDQILTLNEWVEQQMKAEILGAVRKISGTNKPLSNPIFCRLMDILIGNEGVALSIKAIKQEQDSNKVLAQLRSVLATNRQLHSDLAKFLYHASVVRKQKARFMAVSTAPVSFPTAVPQTQQRKRRIISTEINSTRRRMSSSDGLRQFVSRRNDILRDMEQVGTLIRYAVWEQKSTDYKEQLVARVTEIFTCHHQVARFLDRTLGQILLDGGGDIFYRPLIDVSIGFEDVAWSIKVASEEENLFKRQALIMAAQRKNKQVHSEVVKFVCAIESGELSRNYYVATDTTLIIAPDGSPTTVLATPEIFHHVCSYLGVKSIAQLACTCTALNRVSYSKEIICSYRWNSNVDDYDARKLVSMIRKHRAVKWLRLGGFQHKITDIVLQAILLDCDDLQILELLELPEVTGKMFYFIAAFCQKLRWFYLADLRRVFTDRMLLAITLACQKIRFLRLKFCTKISDMGIARCAKYWHNLTQLHLDHNDLSDKTTRLIVEKCKRITQLSIFRASNKSVKVIARGLPQLTQLWLHSAIITNKSFRVIAENERLTHLTLSGCHLISNNGIKAVAPQLSYLYIGNCSKVTEACRRAVQNYLQPTQLHPTD